MATVLYHLATDENHHPINAELVDGNGRLHIVPYDEPVEFQSEFFAKKFLEHQAYLGLVEVTQIRTKSGVQYDMEDARQRALQSLEIAERACISDYIINQLEDRVQRNFPPMPPKGRQLSCCIKHKYNLIKAGIRLVGWEPPYEMEDPGLGNTIAAGPSSGLQDQVTLLQGQLLQMQSTMMELLKGKVMEQVAEHRASKANNKNKPSPLTSDASAEGEDSSNVGAATNSIRL
jgi:hypothetical protein